MEDLTTNTMVDRKGWILLMKNIWKRVCIIGATAAIAVQCMALSGLAAGAPSYTAKYGTPSIDGKVSSSEYGPAQKLNKDNTGIFFGQVDLDDPSLDIHYPELTYQFAWNEQNLYVGVTIAEVENIETSKFQIDLSPENKVKDEQRGVFFTFSILNLDSGLVSVARDNYQTAGSKVTSMNITKKVTAKATKTSSGAQMEIAIPLAELQVSGQGRDFSKITLKEGKWGVATYFIGNGLGFTTARILLCPLLLNRLQLPLIMQPIPIKSIALRQAIREQYYLMQKFPEKISLILSLRMFPVKSQMLIQKKAAYQKVRLIPTDSRKRTVISD